LTQEELIKAGYGLRPDPTGNPDGYQRWLAAVSAPAYKLHSAAHPSSRPASSRRSLLPQPSALSTVPELDARAYTTQPSSGWTGPILSGSFQQNATSAQTYSYAANEAAFYVPTVAPGQFGTGTAWMTVWGGLDNVFQAILDVHTTATIATFGIHHEFIFHGKGHAWSKGNDNGGTPFTPQAGDTIFGEEWYCDATGNLNLSGGYACTLMIDGTQHVEWECDQANSSECESYTLKPADLGNGKLGYQAEYIIEDDTDEVVPNSAEWPVFSPLTMLGSACVVQGSGASGTPLVAANTSCKWVTVNNDPSVKMLTDGNASNPFKRGDLHVLITLQTLPSPGVKWTELPTNIYNWNGSNFNSYSVGCARSIGVGPNSHGLANGTPWTTGCDADANGNRSVYQMQTYGDWVKMQDNVATQVTVSPEGVAWAINASGDVLYWNRSQFVKTGEGGCAKSIGVGPISPGLANGTPWITGCDAAADGNRGVYKMQADGAWVEMQDDIATQVAVSPEGVAWAIKKNGDILYWKGNKFVVNATAGCATSIGIGGNSRGLKNGTPWITGCHAAADGNYDVYQMQTGGAWIRMQDDVGTQIAVSSDGNAWAICKEYISP